MIAVIGDSANQGSIRLHQERGYPGRVSGTSLFNPDFYELARSFGMASARITHKEEIATVIQAAFQSNAPILLEVNTSLDAILP